MKTQAQALLQNIFPGFVVSLISLPLSLGLAIASGAPPMAGIISSVVGGVLVSLVGGSHIAITGPGNGLVVVTLSAIAALGAGDPVQGYFYLLGAVVVSGAFLFLLGLLQVGSLVDFFPSAAVQGLLAAIGLIIMSKQLHLMLGVDDPQATRALALLAEVPRSVKRVFQGEVPVLAYTLGLGSLVFLFLYARLRNSWLQLVPAPMWVVLIGIGLSYWTENQPENFVPLPPALLLQIPNAPFDAIVLPDFGAWHQSAFWSAVVALTFISALESLLSMKAIDRLDPRKRRSDVNRGLRALGLATVVSGALGGLNVVKVIARSSVNVNHGASNRASNFFHGLFLFLFVFLFAPQLQHIPLPSLAAILVYTGYKLCSPSVFQGIARVGYEQLLIFTVTLLTTLLSDLITGILVGTLLSVVIQLRAMGKLDLLLGNLFRPNTLLLQEDADQYHLSVRAYSSFLNFLGLKRKLDSLPRRAKVIIDFSLADFVDYSVLEQLDAYQQNFRSAGGDLEILGTDNMESITAHPQASRRYHPQRKPEQRAYSRREKTIRLFARKLTWEFNPEPDYSVQAFRYFNYFLSRTIDHARNRAEGWQGRTKLYLADLHYYEGAYTARQHLHSTMVDLLLPQDIPAFVLNRENLLDRVVRFSAMREINFELHPDFSRRFKLQGEDEAAIRSFFDRDLIAFLEENYPYHVESNGKGLLIFARERLATISETKQLVSFAIRLADLLNRKL